MGIEKERRILHITTDKLEKVKDTQLAFEDARDERGLSYFGGCFGGRYDQNAKFGEGNISRFARYNSNPMFKVLLFNQQDPNWDYENGDLAEEYLGGEFQGNIILSTAAELTSNSGNTGHPTPDMVDDRSNIKFSVSIGRHAAKNANTQNSVYVGDTAGQDSAGWHATCVGYKAGINSQTSFSTFIGERAGMDSNGYRSIAIGSQSTVNLGESVAIGSHSSAGRKSIAIGLESDANPPQFGSQIVSDGMISIGVQSGGISNRGTDQKVYDTVSIGTRAGSGQVNSFNNVNVGTDSGVGANTYHSVCIGSQSGVDENDGTVSAGHIFLGWEAGYNTSVVDNPNYPNPIVFGRMDDGGIVENPVTMNHRGFNIGIGGLSLLNSRGSDNIGIGYGAGMDSNGGDSFDTINIGSFAGQSTHGTYTVNIGAFAGCFSLASRSTFIGRHSGVTAYNHPSLIAAGLRAGDNDVFELSEGHEIVGTAGLGKIVLGRVLLSGNFAEGWIWANNMFGMAPIDDELITTLHTPHARRGHMIYNNTDNEPKYYDGTAWQSFGGGGGGASSFITLSDTPSSYGNAGEVATINGTRNGLEFLKSVKITSTGFTVYNSAGTQPQFAVNGASGEINTRALNFVIDSPNKIAGFTASNGYQHIHFTSQKSFVINSRPLASESTSTPLKVFDGFGSLQKTILDLKGLGSGETQPGCLLAPHASIPHINDGDNRTLTTKEWVFSKLPQEGGANSLAQYDATGKLIIASGITVATAGAGSPDTTLRSAGYLYLASETAMKFTTKTGETNFMEFTTTDRVDFKITGRGTIPAMRIDSVGRVTTPNTTVTERYQLATKEYADKFGIVDYHEVTGAASTTTVSLDYADGDFQHFTSTYSGSTTVIVDPPENMSPGKSAVIVFTKPNTTHAVNFRAGGVSRELIPITSDGTYMFTVTLVTGGRYFVSHASELLF